MARLPRLVVPGLAHLVIQRGHSARPVFVDWADRLAYLSALREAAAAEGVQLHAFALLDDEVRLFVTPQTEPALGRFMQAVGRRYVSAYNRRHACAGPLWSGRFRSAVVEPGGMCLLALRWVDGAAAADAGSPMARASHVSAAHRLGDPRDAALTDPPAYWQLGNTPFEREAAYRQLLAAGLSIAQANHLRKAVWTGKSLAGAGFVAGLGAAALRRETARPRGRPKRITA